jgi:hypothetical protein
MVAVGSNMFYTVTLPVTLWFLDKGNRTYPPPFPGRELCSLLQERASEAKDDIY